MMKDFQLFFGDRKPMPQWRSILGWNRVDRLEGGESWLRETQEAELVAWVRG